MKKRSGSSASIGTGLRPAVPLSHPIQKESSWLALQHSERDLLQRLQMPFPYTTRTVRSRGESVRKAQCEYELSDKALQRIQEIVARRSKAVIQPSTIITTVNASSQRSLLVDQALPRYNTPVQPTTLQPIEMPLNNKQISRDDLAPRPYCPQVFQRNRSKEETLGWASSKPTSTIQNGAKCDSVGTHARRDGLLRRYSEVVVRQCPITVQEYVTPLPVPSAPEEVGSYPEEGGTTAVGTAEFQTPLPLNADKESALLLEKEAHIEFLRKLLSKSMKALRSLQEQLSLLRPASEHGADKTALLDRLQHGLADNLGESNLDQLGHFLDALCYSTEVENDRLIQQKVQLLGTKYGDDVKSLAQKLVQLVERPPNEAKCWTLPTPGPLPIASEVGIPVSKEMDESLSPIHMPERSFDDISLRADSLGQHNPTESPKTRQPKSTADHPQADKLGTAQLTFQHERADEGRKRRRTSPFSSEPQSPAKFPEVATCPSVTANRHTSSASKATFQRNRNCSCAIKDNADKPLSGRRDFKVLQDLHEFESRPEQLDSIGSKDQQEPKEGKDTISGDDTTGAQDANIHKNITSGKENARKMRAESLGISANNVKQPRTDHRAIEVSLSLARSEQHNESIEANITHIETAMNDFLGGFRNIKAELSHIEETMLSCAQHGNPK